MFNYFAARMGICLLILASYRSDGMVAEWIVSFGSCSKDTGLNPAAVSHYVTTVSKLFTPTVPSWVEGRHNQLTPSIAGNSVATRGSMTINYVFLHRLTCLLSLLSLIGG